MQTNHYDPASELRALIGMPVTLVQGEHRLAGTVSGVAAVVMDDSESNEEQVAIETPLGPVAAWVEAGNWTTIYRIFPPHEFNPDEPIQLVWREGQA